MALVQNIKPTNPISLIAIFAGLSEIAMTYTITNLKEEELKEIFIWFTIFYPVLLVGLFFLILWHDNTLLYPPSEIPQFRKNTINMNQIDDNREAFYMIFLRLLHEYKGEDRTKLISAAFDNIDNDLKIRIQGLETALISEKEIEELLCN